MSLRDSLDPVPRIKAVTAVFFPARPERPFFDEVRDALALKSVGQQLCCNGLQLALLPSPMPGWFAVAGQAARGAA